MMEDDEPDLSPPAGGGGEEASWLTSFGDLMSLLLVFFLLQISPQAVVSQDQQEKQQQLGEAIEKIKAEASNMGIENEIKIESEGNTAKLTLQETLLFSPGKANLDKENEKAFEKILGPLRELRSSHDFEIHGHSDSQPIHSKKFPSNWYLSTARALAILDQFLEEGFPGENLSALGYAQFKPLFPEFDKNRNPIPENRAKNRRVEIFIRLHQR